MAKTKFSKSAALAKSPSMKRSKAAKDQSMLALAERYGAGEKLAPRDYNRVKAWALRSIDAREALAFVAIRLAVAHNSMPHEHPTSIPLEKQHAVILTRLEQNGKCAAHTLMHMSDAMDRLSAVATLTNEILWSDDDDDVKRKAILVALSALGRLGSEELHEARNKLEDADFDAKVTPEHVAALDKAEGVTSEGGEHAEI